MSARETALEEIVRTCTGWVRTTPESQVLARAELATLSAIIKEQEQDIANVTHREAVVVGNYRRTVEQQARQLAEAERVIWLARNAANNKRVSDAAAAWLAANAPPDADVWVSGMVDVSGSNPAPRAEQEQGYREALEKIESIWVGESVTDEHIAALKMYTVAARVLNNADEKQEQAT